MLSFCVCKTPKIASLYLRHFLKKKEEFNRRNAQRIPQKHSIFPRLFFGIRLSKHLRMTSVLEKKNLADFSFLVETLPVDAYAAHT